MPMGYEKKKSIKVTQDKKEPAKVTKTMKVKDLASSEKGKGTKHSPIKNGQ